jgi:hypothetical protein
VARQSAELGELGTAYERGRGRIFDLVSGLDEETASGRVPACPSWSIHDLLAHLAGNCTDIVTGNIAGAATEPWTAAQVEARRDWALPKVLAEWSEVGPQIAAMLDEFPGRYGSQVVADLASHEHDLYGALRRTGERDSESVAIGIDFLVTVVLHPAMVSFGVGPLDVKVADRSWIVGTGDVAAQDPDLWRTAAGSDELISPPTRTPAGMVSTEPFELFRAIAGRRSAAQIRAFEWTVDPEPYLPTFGYGPFTVRPTDLDE